MTNIESATPPNLTLAIALCWLSLATIPLGLIAIGGGPCAGPRTLIGAVYLAMLGISCLAMTGYGVFRIIRYFRIVETKTKVLGIISVFCACCVASIGVLYLLIGLASTWSFR